MTRSGTGNQLADVRARIEKFEPVLHALLNQEVIADGGKGPLAGLVGSIKDVIVTKGVETTAASTMLKGWIPPYDATVVTRLKQAGATLIGKTNCDAWAHGSSTENSDFGPTKNPWDNERVPGGSSGGAAAAVSAGYGDFAIGTDTGGSIRQPAAFCGVTGLKPTYGRVSRYGLIAMASSLDTIGPIARDAATCARVLEAICGHDPADATSVPGKSFSAANVLAEIPEWPGKTSGGTFRGGAKLSSHPLAGLRVGVAKEYFAQGLASEVETAVRNAIAKLEKLGATLVEISLPMTPYALACYYIIQPAEVSSNLARFDGIRFGHSAKRIASNPQRMGHIELVKQTRAEGFGAEAKRRIILGTFVLSAGYVEAYYKKAMRVRTLLRREFEEAFREVDVIATPATPNLPFKLGAHTNDPLAMYLEDVYTAPANLVGIPGVSLPCGLAKPKDGNKELPIGLQLLGPMFGEELILRVAHVYQQVTDYHQRRPL